MIPSRFEKVYTMTFYIVLIDLCSNYLHGLTDFIQYLFCTVSLFCSSHWSKGSTRFEEICIVSFYTIVIDVYTISNLLHINFFYTSNEHSYVHVLKNFFTPTFPYSQTVYFSHTRFAGIFTVTSFLYYFSILRIQLLVCKIHCKNLYLTYTRYLLGLFYTPSSITSIGTLYSVHIFHSAFYVNWYVSIY